MVKKPPANAGDTEDVGSIPRSGRPSGVGNGNPIQYSCLENAMDTRACGLQSLGSQIVRYDYVCAHACTHTHTPTHTRRRYQAQWFPGAEGRLGDEQAEHEGLLRQCSYSMILTVDT